MVYKKITTKCNDCRLRSNSIFAEVTRQELEKACFVPEVVSYSSSTSIVNSSLNNDAIFTLRKGNIKLVRSMPDGSMRITSLLKPGDTLGLRAWQTGDYKFDAISLNDVELCRIPHREFERIRKYSKDLDRTVLNRLCKESELAEVWITQFSTGSVNQRFASLLLFLASHQNKTNSKTVKLLSRDDMASILAVRPESVSRAVTQFKLDSLIEQNSRGEYTINLPGLRKKLRQK